MKCLIVKSPFAQYIVQGAKHHEFRKRPTKIRGRIGIIEGAPNKPIGIGMREIIGDVELWFCSFQNSDGSYCWELRRARHYKHPVIIELPRGAQTWVNVDYTPPPDIYEELSPAELYRLEVECSIEQSDYLNKYLRRGAK